MEVVLSYLLGLIFLMDQVCFDVNLIHCFYLIPAYTSTIERNSIDALHGSLVDDLYSVVLSMSPECVAAT